MKCSNCKKEFSHEGCSVYVEGKLTLSFCSTSCHGKFFKKATRALKKMSKEELDIFLESIKR